MLDGVYVSSAPSVIGAGGRVVIASTTGVPRGWFYELVHHPTPETWMYRSDVNDNPEANPGVMDFLRRRLSLISPSAAMRELGGEFTDDDDAFFSPAIIAAATDNEMGELSFSARPAYAFLDLSRRRDLTSLVVVVREEARRPEAGDHLVVASVQVWNPRDSPTGEVDFAEVRASLAALPWRFPTLEKVLVDEGAEGGAVLPFCRQHPQLSLLVGGFVASPASNMALWSSLASRLNARTITIPAHQRLIAELRSLRQQSFALGSKWRVVDSSRRLHRDVSVALAGACYAAGSGEDAMPVMVIGSPTYHAWVRDHPMPETAPASAPVLSKADREQLWAQLAPLLAAWERGDESGIDRAADNIEAYVSAIERADRVKAAQLRELIERIFTRLTEVADAVMA